MPTTLRFNADNRCPACGASCGRLQQADGSWSVELYDRAGERHVCRPAVQDEPVHIEYVTEGGRRRRRTSGRSQHNPPVPAVQDEPDTEAIMQAVRRAVPAVPLRAGRPTLESMGAQAALERLRDSWAVVSTAAVQWSQHQNDLGEGLLREDPAGANARSYAEDILQAVDVCETYIPGEGAVQALVDAEVAARERGAQPTPSALDVLNRFVLFLRANPDAVQAVTADDCATRHWVQEWADAEYGSVAAGEVTAAVARGDFLNAEHPLRSVHGVTDILRALRRLPHVRATADEQRLLFLLRAYDVRLHQINRHGDDVRPEVNECWWVDLLGLYGDKAIDSGRTGAWEERMADIAALACAAVEWKRRQDGDLALNAQRVVAPPESETVESFAADLERLLSEDIRTSSGDVQALAEAATTRVQLEGTPWVPSEGTVVQGVLSGGQIMPAGSTAQVFFVQPDGTRVQVGRTDGPVTFTPRYTAQPLTAEEEYARTHRGTFRYPGLCPECGATLREVSGTYRCDGCGYAECG